MKRSDGGQQERAEFEHPFEIVSSQETSRKRRYGIMYDEYVRTPFLVAWSDYRARIGLLIISIFVIVGTVGVWLAPEPYANMADRLVSPGLAHPLGTDGLGQDLISVTIYATPAMLEMILAGAVLSVGIGTAIGVVAGFKGGFADRLLMSITDVVLMIPGLPLIVVLAAIFQPDQPWLIGIVLGIDAWPGLARSLRSQVLTIRTESYVEASRAMGLPTSNILLKDITPSLMPYIMINFMNAARNVIFASVGLYFLGLLPFTTLNWGVMMQMAYEQGAFQIQGALHWFVVPMAAMTLLSLGLILFAQGTDRLFNPRVRARHAKIASGDEPETGEDGPSVSEQMKK